MATLNKLLVIRWMNLISYCNQLSTSQQQCPVIWDLKAVKCLINPVDYLKRPCFAPQGWSLLHQSCWWCLVRVVVLLWYFFLLVTLYGVYSWRRGGFKLLYSTGRGSSSTESVITCAKAPTQIYWFFYCLFTSFLDMLYTSCLPWCSAGSLNP